MACGKVMNYRDVKAEDVGPDMAEGHVTIRWLIAEKDGARTFYMRLFEMSPRAKIKAHFHPWEHEIFILKGSGRLRIGKTWHEVKSEMFVFIPPNVEHEYEADEEGLTFLCLIPAKPTAEKVEKPIEC